ncbi:ATP-binding cassette domain-containing protein, partial [Nocardioides sp. R-C-SC26]|uniref:ATP-binding cassette domain-containing protein n=1 Tax=Nocardioides sp. R-C-SC26 TaxID=2870414 RepID=UPI001E4F8865
MTAPVVARGLVKGFVAPDGSRVVAGDDVDFEAPAGEVTAIVGQSGSGKTTLLQLLAGHDKPDAGSVRLAGVEIAEVGDATVTRLRRRQVGFVFQAFNL